MTWRSVAPTAGGGWALLAAALAVALVVTGLLPAFAPVAAATADARLEAPSGGDRPVPADQTGPLLLAMGGTLPASAVALPVPLPSGRVADRVERAHPARAGRVPSPPPRNVV